MTREEELREKIDQLAIDIEDLKSKPLKLQVSEGHVAAINLHLSLQGPIRVREHQKASYELELAALQSAPAGEAPESTREPESTSTDADLQKGTNAEGNRATRKRGPRPNWDRHKAIAAVVTAYGDSWRDPRNLEKIAAELQDKGISSPKKWATLDKERPKKKGLARTWPKGFDFYPDLFVKALAYSLEMADRVNAN